QRRRLPCRREGCWDPAVCRLRRGRAWGLRAGRACWRRELASARFPLEVSLVFGPVQDALLPYIEKADGNEAEVHEHLPEAEEARAGERGQAAEDDGPGKHEDCFHIEEDEEHCHHVEADGEAAARIANGIHAALVGAEFGTRVFVPADEEG